MPCGERVGVGLSDEPLPEADKRIGSIPRVRCPSRPIQETRTPIAVGCLVAQNIATVCKLQYHYIASVFFVTTCVGISPPIC